MKRAILVTAAAAGLLGFVAGNAFWYLASPLWIDRVVSEGIAPELQSKTHAAGSFKDADAGHRGKGKATLFVSPSGAATLRFTEFEVTNGPDLEVWLVKASKITAKADVTGSKWISLGALKGNIGDQNYAIPAGTSLAEYGSVVIWCEQFSVLFASAALEPG
jgi:hypothetical protein